MLLCLKKMNGYVSKHLISFGVEFERLYCTFYRYGIGVPVDVR
mgnify:CR=1 FL=1